MKKIFLSLVVGTTCFAMAESFSVIVSKDNNNYIVGVPSKYVETGVVKCDSSLPLTIDIYKGTTFEQNNIGCEKEEKDQYESIRWTSIDDFVKTETGTLVLNDCKSISENNHSRGDGLYDVNLSQSGETVVYCDMTLDGGGWTLAGVMANDNNHYWTWDNKSNLYNNATTGNVENLSQDFQSEAWHELNAEELLLASGDKTKALRYDDVLNNQTLKSIYPSSNIQSKDFTADKVIGSLYYQTVCDTPNTYTMRTMTPDSDSHGWVEASIGFVWMADNNDGGCWDDNFGGLSSAMTGHTNTERTWGINRFYGNNFRDSNLHILIR